ncbi:MAG: alkane 1-monooxygenase [Gammaproteobacteria bacterium]|nr:alkane 1-monooxygenase [Gammaproteobacteria bacterium]NNL45779.1 alkane 1-monooxygenase [Woeseiaceae bacterium]
MKGYTAVLPDGELHYVDRKRWLWLLSVVYPLQPFLAIWLHFKTGNELWFLLPFATSYIIAPLLDWAIGEDRNNPPEEIVMQLDQDRYYRWLTYAVVPLHLIALVGCVWYATSASVSWWAFVLIAITAGLTSGLAINTGHELGHKNSKIEKLLAKVVLAIPAYGHFSIEHNRGHHRDVSTPADPASSRMGESIYKFARREIPSAFRRAWQIEKERLTLRGKSVWHRSNAILQSYAMTAALSAILLWLFGWSVVPFLFLHNVFAYWQLTSANYVEHYGLLRQRDVRGRYERCQPHHSWNSNHILSNLVMFHLERHSDHHAHPLRRYQSLRHFEDLPSLPNGYFGMYVMAYIPWLWFYVMDKRLMALPHVQGDLDKVNIDPDARASLFLKWGRDKMVEPTITDIPGL